MLSIKKFVENVTNVSRNFWPIPGLSPESQYLVKSPSPGPKSQFFWAEIKKI